MQRQAITARRTSLTLTTAMLGFAYFMTFSFSWPFRVHPHPGQNESGIVTCYHIQQPHPSSPGKTIECEDSCTRGAEFQRMPSPPTHVGGEKPSSGQVVAKRQIGKSIGILVPDRIPPAIQLPESSLLACSRSRTGSAGPTDKPRDLIANHVYLLSFTSANLLVPTLRSADKTHCHFCGV